MKIRILLILLFFCTVKNEISAQNSLRKLTTTYRDTIVLKDSLTIIPNTIEVRDSNSVLINNFIFYKQKLIFKDKKPISSKIYIVYRVFPFDLEKKITHLDSSKIDKKNIVEWHWLPDKEDKKNNLLPESKGLNYGGAFSRGISVGNNQDLVVNSNFNLQMSGKISNEIEVNASITDNNIPIQPDGNTAQLVQFDRIFINLKRKNTSLSAGDFELQRPNSYFMNYFKRAQGLALEHVENLEKSRKIQTKSAIAVSKGKFTRQNITPIEGNQGPYRLLGGEGERFIIVMAGTEKLYIDGKLAQRGIDNDYTIDYNQGIVTFTAKMLIKRELRIIAEFEYNDQNYVRTMYSSSNTYSFSRGRMYLNLYGEQDSRGSGSQGVIRPKDKTIFSEAGDAADVLADGVDTIKIFDKDRILYAEQKDGQNNSFFVFSSNPDSAKYSLKFVEVSPYQGDYIISITNSNGRVYKYVGMGNGSYRIGAKLSTPKLLQLYTIGGEYQFFKKKNAVLSGELALSNRDNNRFSSKNDNDNLGWASFFNYKQNYIWKKKWKLLHDVAYEKTSALFKPLNPYRSAEFSRDWNSGNTSTNPFEENILKTSLSITRDSLGQVHYEYGRFDQKNNYNGEKHQGFFKIDKKNWEISANANYLKTNGLYEKSFFTRPKFELRRNFKNQNSIGFLASREKNNRYVADTLSKTSFYFDIWRAFADMNLNKNLQASAYYQERSEYFPLKNVFEKNIFTKEASTTISYKNKKGFSVNGNISYRKLIVNNQKLTAQLPQDTYLGRIDASLSKWKNALYVQTSYELGSGQEQKIEYFYQKVETGRGNFTWRDVNKDEKIQQDEIFPVIFRDSANVIRFIVTTNQFIATNNLNISQIVNLSPKNIWSKDSSFLKKIAQHFNSENNLQIQRKVKTGSDVSPWNPFEQLSIYDTSLVTYATNLRNVLYFNRGNIKYDLQIGFTDNSARNILTTGYDIRQQQERFLKGRWNITPNITLKTTLSKGLKVSENEFYVNRNYTIYSIAAEPELSWQPIRDFRLRFAYKYSQNIDTLAEKESAFIHDLNTDITYNRSIKTSIRAKFSLVAIDYNGEKNSAVQYAMLNGLQNGKNYLWGLQVNQALNKTLQLEFRYEGRKTGDVRIVHTGNMSVRAVF